MPKMIKKIKTKSKNLSAKKSSTLKIKVSNKSNSKLNLKNKPKFNLNSKTNPKPLKKAVDAMVFLSITAISTILLFMVVVNNSTQSAEILSADSSGNIITGMYAANSHGNYSDIVGLDTDYLVVIFFFIALAVMTFKARERRYRYKAQKQLNKKNLTHK